MSIINRLIAKLERFVHLTSDDVEALAAATARHRTIGPRVDLIREGDQP
ncbi:hypothetical protein [Sphingomonas japonica]|nr:hypothetical protein [Sphingomonas japonica]